VAANLVWYFISPYAFFPRLLSGEIGLVAGTTLVTVGLVVYLDMAFVRRSFCRTVCPYGRIQLMAMDRNTLTLEFDAAQIDRCIRCGSCEHVCPMGIDIKRGLQVECINCGRCLDACREVMGRRGSEGLIRYTFGNRSEGGGRPFNPRSLILGVVVILLCVALFVGVTSRREATIKIQRGGVGETRRLQDGAVVAQYTAFLENRSQMPARYDVSVSGTAVGGRAEALGPVRGILISPNDNRRVDFLVKISPPLSREHEVTFRLERDGKVVATARALLRVD
jgi:polyferredoxin